MRQGRPRLLDKRNHDINITLTVHEHQLAQALAAEHSAPFSTWLRQEAFRAIEQLLA